jgi:hypothetical protein
MKFPTALGQCPAGLLLAAREADVFLDELGQFLPGAAARRSKRHAGRFLC